MWYHAPVQNGLLCHFTCSMPSLCYIGVRYLYSYNNYHYAYSKRANMQAVWWVEYFNIFIFWWFYVIYAIYWSYLYCFAELTLQHQWTCKCGLIEIFKQPITVIIRISYIDTCIVHISSFLFISHFITFVLGINQNQFPNHV